VEDVVSVSEVIDIAETILAELRQPFSLSGEIVTTHASLGISLGDSQTPSADVLLKQASIAMHKVKQSPHQRYCIFEDSIRGGNQSSLRLEMDLKRAIAQQELFLEYQPIVLVRNQKIIGMESLVRWHHSEQGVLPPTKFIPLAEKTGLIIPLGWWVLEESCRQLKHWQDTIPNVASLFVSVNMSSQQFSQADFLDRLTHILKSTGLDPKYLKIEITEGVLIENSESIIAILDAIRAMGIKLSIDDFGTGYSSLSYLHRFPVDTLKIDRSFLENADSDFEKLEILQSVVRLAWNLGLEVVAEGIETQRHLAQITSLRCESGQGFFFSRPLSQQAMEDFLSEET
jgi:EAL domain-containing protein (putative c-di-GMP-specific phosphodiesterase class I)